MTILHNFPALSQLTAQTSDGSVSENREFDCVAAAVGMGIQWYRGKTEWDTTVGRLKKPTALEELMRKFGRFAMIAIRARYHQVGGVIRATTSERYNMINVIAFIYFLMTVITFPFLISILVFDILNSVFSWGCSLAGIPLMIMDFALFRMRFIILSASASVYFSVICCISLATLRYLFSMSSTILFTVLLTFLSMISVILLIVNLRIISIGLIKFLTTLLAFCLQSALTASMEIIKGSRFPFFALATPLFTLVQGVNWLFNRTAYYANATNAIFAKLLSMKVVKSGREKLLALRAAFLRYNDIHESLHLSSFPRSISSTREGFIMSSHYTTNPLRRLVYGNTC